MKDQQRDWEQPQQPNPDKIQEAGLGGVTKQDLDLLSEQLDTSRTATERLMRNLGLMTVSLMTPIEPTFKDRRIESADLPAPGERPGIHFEGVSDPFAKQMGDAYRSIPENIRQQMENAGFHVRIVNKLTDARPELKGQSPRGWAPGSTWDDAEGTVIVQDKTVYVAEKMKRSGDWITGDRGPGVLRHEFGHGLNAAWGTKGERFSDSDEFKAAYERDVAKLTKEDRERLKYQLQPGFAGRDEAFADVFSLLCGGAANKSDEETIRRAFPEVTRLLRSRM